MFKKSICLLLAVILILLTGCSAAVEPTENTPQITEEALTPKEIVLTTDTKEIPYDASGFSIDINVENAVLKDTLTKEMVILQNGAEEMKVSAVERLSDTSLNVKAEGTVAEYVLKNYDGFVTVNLADAFVTDETEETLDEGEELAPLSSSLSIPVVFPRVNFKSETLGVSQKIAAFEIGLENAAFAPELSSDSFELAYTGEGKDSAAIKSVTRKDDGTIQVQLDVNTDDIKEVQQLLSDYVLSINPNALSSSDKLTVYLSCPAPDMQADVTYFSADENGTDVEIELTLLNGSFESITKDMLSFEDDLSAAEDVDVAVKDGIATVSLHLPKSVDSETYFGVIVLDNGVKNLYGETAGATALVIAQSDEGERIFAELAEMTAKQIAVSVAEKAIKKAGAKGVDMAFEKVMGKLGLSTAQNTYNNTNEIKSACTEINTKCDEIKTEMTKINSAMKQYFSAVSTQIDDLDAYIKNRDLNKKISEFDEEIGNDTMLAMCRYNDLFTNTMTAYSDMLGSYDEETKTYNAEKKSAYEKANQKLMDQLSSSTIRGRDIVHATFAMGRAIMGSKTNRSFIYDYDDIVVPHYNFEEASYLERNNYRHSIETLYEKAVAWSSYLLSATEENSTYDELMEQETQVLKWFEDNELTDETPETKTCLTYGVLVDTKPVYSRSFLISPYQDESHEYTELNDGDIFGTIDQWKEMMDRSEKLGITLYDEMKLAGFEVYNFEFTASDINPPYSFSGTYFMPRQSDTQIRLEDETKWEYLGTAEYGYQDYDSSRWENSTTKVYLSHTKAIHLYTESGQDKAEIAAMPHYVLSSERLDHSRTRCISRTVPYGIYYVVSGKAE